MGWLSFWGSDDKSSSDAVKNLDPSLREFLDKEQPKHQPPKPQPEQSSWLSKSDAAPFSEPQTDEVKSIVPKESLFPDGRYAHIWKNYTPLKTIEQSQMSEQDKLRDLVDDRDMRKAELGRVALENCVFEHLALEDCYNTPGLINRMTLCSAEKGTFTRCYKMQANFMKALGFIDAVGDMERQERIQMHADKLYRQMLTQERMIAEAKERGEPEPIFESPLSPKKVGAALYSLPASREPVDPSLPFARIPEPFRKDFEKEVEGMTPLEQAVEEAAFLADLEQQRRVGQKGAEYLVEEVRARQRRFEKGTPTIGDRIKRATGWDDNLKGGKLDGIKSNDT